jgi:hypothetical protein
MLTDADDRQKVQIKVPVAVWRKTKAEAALRGVDVQDLVAEALISHLGIGPESERKNPMARAG